LWLADVDFLCDANGPVISVLLRDLSRDREVVALNPKHPSA
jgi:hypothetical protein